MTAWFRNDAWPQDHARAAIAGLAATCGLQRREAELLFAHARSCETTLAGCELKNAASSGRTHLVLSGWACQLRILADGRRQIFAFLLAGDPIQAAGPEVSGERLLTALTRVETLDLTTLLKQEEAEGRFDLRAVLARAMEQRRERLFNHVVRLGRLDALERVTDLLLELRDRLYEMGQVKDETFRLPLTQENIADALGLSVVHVNRTLQQLRRQGLISQRAGVVTLHKIRTLREIVGSDRVDQPPRSEPGVLLQA